MSVDHGTPPIGSLHHVGIAVRDLETTEAFLYEALRLPTTRRLDMADLGLRMAFFDCGPALIELVEFADPALTAARIGDRPAALDHIALAVPEPTSGGVIWQLLELAAAASEERR
ncbi:VOC family protein [Actinomadura spongiicola]|uniref:VOC family protein n=1 Tax=Actinomadura spongiicola TaxID=2303421 RepID=UPI0013146AC2|nr:VOC family protein [Actinomadura spongiicola]